MMDIESADGVKYGFWGSITATVLMETTRVPSQRHMVIS